MADKHNIPKDKMQSNCRFLPEDIVCKITQRNNIRRANTCDPALKILNEEITSDIQKQIQNIWKEHLDAHWDHRHNTHTLWRTIHGLSNRAPPHTLNTSITFIGPLGLALFTIMFKTALNKNIIPHTWKLANIFPILKPNKDTDKGTSYRPISLLSVIAKHWRRAFFLT